MTGTVRRAAYAAAVLLVATAQGTIPAVAVTPPPIDTTMLPAAAPAAPPEPTVQRQDCAEPLFDPDRTMPPAQNLDAVWRLTTGAGQTVAVIDTGVSPHPRLRTVRPGGDYVSAGDGTQDCDGHGTIVAGIISAASDAGGSTAFSGVAPGVDLISIRQSSVIYGPADDASTSGFGDVTTMAMAVRTAADLGASVINISSVACTSTVAALDDRALGAALAYAVDTKDVVVVAAAGNVGGAGQCPRQTQAPDGEMSWDAATVAVSPAWYDDYVLTVGSVDHHGAPSSFSLAGPWVDVAAPGEDVVSLNPAGGGLVNSVTVFGSAVAISGTSYAAPVVSGIAALVRSRFPELRARAVMARLEATAHHPAGGWDPVVGSGVVDPLAAVSNDTAEPSATTAQPRPVSSAPAEPVAATGRTSRGIAVIGAVGCLGVLAVVALLGSAAVRLRRIGDDDVTRH